MGGGGFEGWGGGEVVRDWGCVREGDRWEASDRVVGKGMKAVESMMPGFFFSQPTQLDGTGFLGIAKLLEMSESTESPRGRISAWAGYSSSAGL